MKILLLFCLIGLSHTILAQQTSVNGDSNAIALPLKDSISIADSTVGLTDSLHYFLRFHTPNPIPKRAGFYSAILPGLGQIYDKKYVKAGVVWLATAGAAYNLIHRNNVYQTYRQAYVYRIDNDPSTVSDTKYDNLDNTALQSIQANERIKRDKTFIIIAGVYFLNIADALVTAHLKSFDVSNDISLQVRPLVTPYYAGIGVRLGFN